MVLTSEGTVGFSKEKALEWIDVNDRLPKLIIDKEGHVNNVLVYWKGNFDGGFNEDVVSVPYFLKRTDEFTHWSYLPARPKNK